MGLYYRQSDGSDICVSGSASSTGGGFSEVIAGNKSLLASVSSKLTLAAGTGITITGDPTNNTLTITGTESGATVVVSPTLTSGVEIGKITVDGTVYTLYTQDISGKADKATTLFGYGITDVKIESGTITIGSDSITPLTAYSSLDASKVSGTLPSSTYTNTTYNVATTSADGLLSSVDKTKLDGIDEGANANVNSDWNATTGYAQILNKPTKLTDFTNDLSVATTTDSGLMSSSDKAKLDDFGGTISDSFIEALFATQEGSQITTAAEVEAISTSYITNQFN